MSFLCTHGEILAKCNTCLDFQEELEILLAEPDYDSAQEYLYDLYLEADERALSESEEV